jgi:hypothetical protein
MSRQSRSSLLWIVSEKASAWNIREFDCCGEAVGIKSYQLKLLENQTVTGLRTNRCVAGARERCELPSPFACNSRSLFKPQAGDHFPPSPNEEPFLIDSVVI